MAQIMQRILSVENMRDSDAATIKGGIPGEELMYRAAQGIYSVVEAEHGWNGAIGIVCGSGNNAGDGYALALILQEKGIGCDLIRTSSRLSEDGGKYYRKCTDKKITVKEVHENSDFNNEYLTEYDILVDCIYGTGFHGELREPVLGIINGINAARSNGTYVVAVDINSGLNGANGLGDDCVVSDLTVSVGDFQPGHYLNRAKDVMKKKVNYPIGIEPIRKPFYLFEGDDVKKVIPERKNHANKGTYGYIALIGGSARYSGAIRLAYIANASMRSGAGVTSVAVPKSISSVVASHILESTIFPLDDVDGEVLCNEAQILELIKHKRAIAFGMGIGRSTESANILKYLLINYEGILIIDADGISDLADIGNDYLASTKAKVILTPHVKECSRITGKSVDDIMRAPIETAVAYAKENNVIMLLKGPSTIVTDGEEVYIVDRGCAGMATAGSGDVLSGIEAAICAYASDDLAGAVAAGAYINGAAGEMAQDKYGSVGMVASDTAVYVAKVIKALCG